MMKRSTDSKILFKYKRGELGEGEARLLEKELENDGTLKAEMELIKSIDSIEKMSEPDENRWQQIENNVFTSLNNKPVEKESTAFTFRPAYAAVFSLLLLIAASLYMFDDKKLQNNEIQISKIKNDNLAKNDTAETEKPQPEKEPVFDIGSINESGIASDFKLLRFKGENNSQNFDKRNKIRAGNALETGKDGFVHFAFNQNVKISMLESTRIVFHEFEGQVMPYLENGTVVIDIKHDDQKKFVLLANKTRLYDIGTLFAVKYGKGDGMKVEVEKGEVLIERPGNINKKIKAKNGALVLDSGAPIEVALNQPKSEAIKQAEAVLRMFIEAEKKEVVKKHLPKSVEKIYNYPKNKPLSKEMPANETKVAKTNWQQSLDKLTPNEKLAIANFFKTTENYMGSGRTLRAIANLENFIRNNPGNISEKALFLLGECHYNLQEYTKSRDLYGQYLDRYPYGTWSEIARMRYIELKRMEK